MIWYYLTNIKWVEEEYRVDTGRPVRRLLPVTQIRASGDMDDRGSGGHLCFHQGPNTLTELKLLPVILQVHWTIPSLYPGCTLPRMPFPTLTAWRTPHSTSKAELKCHLPSMLFILPSPTLVWLNRFPATRAPTNGFLLPTSTKKGQTYCANRPTWLQRSLYFQLNLSYLIWWPWATCSSWELKYRLLS